MENGASSPVRPGGDARPPSLVYHHTRQAFSRTMAWPFVTTESLSEFWHVRDDIVDPVFVQRMRIHEQNCAHHLRTQIAAPDVGVGQEEALQCRQTVFSLGIETLIFPFEVGVKRR